MDKKEEFLFRILEIERLAKQYNFSAADICCLHIIANIEAHNTSFQDLLDMIISKSTQVNSSKQ